MRDLAFPRVASILREGNVVSSISQCEQVPDPSQYRGRAGGEHHCYFEIVSHHVRVGMVKLADGSFHWPEGHPNHTRDSREALAQALVSNEVLKAGRAA